MGQITYNNFTVTTCNFSVITIHYVNIDTVLQYGILTLPIYMYSQIVLYSTYVLLHRSMTLLYIVVNLLCIKVVWR